MGFSYKGMMQQEFLQEGMLPASYVSMHHIAPLHTHSLIKTTHCRVHHTCDFSCSQNHSQPKIFLCVWYELVTSEANYFEGDKRNNDE